DTDGDGTPDYLTDTNGNGLVDGSESDWRSATNSFPYGAGDYLYRVVNPGDVADFYLENFDDSSFTNGQAAFGTTYGLCSDCLNNSSQVRTTWPTNTDLLLRRHFTIPNGTTNLILGMAIDDEAQIFINGTQVTPTNVAETIFVTNTIDGILQR